jgi:signal peptidase I
MNMKILREVVITVVIAAAVFALLRLTVQSYTVVMSSMEPTFQQGDCIMVSKVSYRSSVPQRGDVIVFNPPPPHDNSQYPFIKRVIGLPGEIVEIKDGEVSINGTPLAEDEYIEAQPNYTNTSFLVITEITAQIQVMAGQYLGITSSGRLGLPTGHRANWAQSNTTDTWS